MTVIYDNMESALPIYDKPVRADHAHTENPSELSPEASPKII